MSKKQGVKKSSLRSRVGRRRPPRRTSSEKRRLLKRSEESILARMNIVTMKNVPVARQSKIKLVGKKKKPRRALINKPSINEEKGLEKRKKPPPLPKREKEKMGELNNNEDLKEVSGEKESSDEDDSFRPPSWVASEEPKEEEEFEPVFGDEEEGEEEGEIEPVFGDEEERKKVKIIQKKGLGKKLEKVKGKRRKRRKRKLKQSRPFVGSYHGETVNFVFRKTKIVVIFEQEEEDVEYDEIHGLQRLEIEDEDHVGFEIDIPGEETVITWYIPKKEQQEFEKLLIKAVQNESLKSEDFG